MAFTKIAPAGLSTSGNFTFGDVTVNSIQLSDGSAVGGAGLGTAIDGNDQIYYTDTVLSIGSTTTINPPDSSNIAYTQYAEIAVEEGFDLIVEDGDDLVPDILGLSTETAGVLAGAGGRVRADNFTNKAGTGAPTFPSGINVTGVVTATSFSGDGSALTGIDATSLKDSGDTIRVQANTSGAVVTGVLTATSFSGNVNAGVVTATSSIVVGDSFINATSIGIGTTTTAGRNAGVGTAAGTLIFNSTTAALELFGPLGWVKVKDTNLITATGGDTVDTSSRSGWTVHSFTGPGSFIISSGEDTVEYVVIAGGGGGAGGFPNGANGGGAGAGGMRTGNLTLSPGTYNIQVGGGGAGNPGPAPSSNTPLTIAGTPSFITNPGISSITSLGGGGGGHWNAPNNPTPNPGAIQGTPGIVGSGGGQANNGGATPTQYGEGTPGQGFPGGPVGGDGGPVGAGGGGGGGGAGGAGQNPQVGGVGGNGASSSITGTSVTYAGGGGGGGGWPAPGSPNTAAGGGPGPGGGGAGGAGVSNNNGINGGNGSPATGSGGGGGGAPGPGQPVTTGGNGGDGIVIIAYPTS